MRALFVCRALTGHFEPLVPIARACAEAGHAVAFASGEPIDAEARERGFEAFTAGLAARHRSEWIGRLPAKPTREWFFHEIFDQFERPPRARDLRGIVEDWRPDVLVNDPAELAVPEVAAETGLPYATAGFGVLMERELVEFARVSPRLFFDPYPAALQRPWVGELTTVQRVARAHAPAPPPPWLAALPYERTVYLTFGTVWNRQPERFIAVLDTLHDVNVVVTTGGDLDLGPQPPHVRVERFVPQAAILPYVDAVICHGGAGTVLGALAFGRPLILRPQAADQHDNAAAVLAAGAGVIDGELDASHAAAARRIADEIAAMPAPEAAVEPLVSLARAG